MFEEDGIRVQFEDIGEGLWGDYDENDPDDVPLLRFYIDQYDKETGEWCEVSDASYCTLLPVTTPEELVDRAAKWLYDQVASSIRSGGSYKKTLEWASWMSLETFS